jgi:hypothetical protein
MSMNMNDLWRKKLLGAVNEAPTMEFEDFNAQEFYVDVCKHGGIAMSIEKIEFQRDTLVVTDESENVHTLSEYAYEKLAKKYFNGKSFVFTDSFNPHDATSQMTEFTRNKTFR